MKNSYRSKSILGFTASATALLALLSACSMPESAVYAEAGDEEDSQILAVVGDKAITEAEVEQVMAAQLTRLAQERYDLLKQGLDRLISERLMEAEAGRRGVSVESLLAEEVEAKVTEPTEEEVDAFYEERKAQIRQPKEAVAGQIRDHLRRNQETELNAELVARLKEKYGFQLLLEPVRATVVADGFPTKGPAEAPITIVEFSDFECPYCSRINPALSQVMETYPDTVRVVFRQFPLNIHANAQKAAEASLCADEQGKFWQMHDLLFKEQRSLGVEQLKEKAARLELNTEDFNDCLDSSRYADAVHADIAAGGEVGVTGTPALFINGRFLSGAQPFEEISKVIDEELAMQKTGS